MGLYFGGPDEVDFGRSQPPVWGHPGAGMAVYGQPQAPVVWGQPGPITWGQSLPVFGGDYEIMGAYEILGSPAASPAMKSAAAALIQARAVGGKAVLQTTPRREYAQTLPCTSLEIEAGDSRDIELKPQRPFRPEKFRASSTHTAPFFVISAYSIGQDNQFVGPGTIPVDLFSEVALYSQIEAYTANLGNLITLTVQNIDTETHDFRAAFFGTSLAN